MSQKRGTCLHCGRPGMAIQSRGLCKRCYMDLDVREQYPRRPRSGGYGQRADAAAHQPRGTCVRCGRPDMALQARGLCATCYRRALREGDRVRAPQQPPKTQEKADEQRTLAERLAAAASEAVKRTLREYVHVEETAALVVGDLCECVRQLEESNRLLRDAVVRARSDSLARWKRLQAENPDLVPIPRRGSARLAPLPAETPDDPDDAADPLELDDAEDHEEAEA